MFGQFAFSKKQPRPVCRQQQPQRQQQQSFRNRVRQVGFARLAIQVLAAVWFSPQQSILRVIQRFLKLHQRIGLLLQLNPKLLALALCSRQKPVNGKQKQSLPLIAGEIRATGVSQQ
jgi:hypothetical protein